MSSKTELVIAIYDDDGSPTFEVATQSGVSVPSVNLWCEFDPMEKVSEVSELLDSIAAVARIHDIEPSLVPDRRNGLAFKHAVYLLRRRANMSLEEVAQLAGVSIGRVAQIQSKLESGAVDPLLKRSSTEI